MNTKFSSSKYPKIISGKETLTVSPSISSTTSVGLGGTKAKAYNVFITIDGGKKLLPIKVGQYASSSAEWSNTTRFVDFAAWGFFPGSVDFNGNYLDEFTLIFSGTSADSNSHTVNIIYFIYEDRAAE